MLLDHFLGVTEITTALYLGPLLHLSGMCFRHLSDLNAYVSASLNILLVSQVSAGFQRKASDVSSQHNTATVSYS